MTCKRVVVTSRLRKGNYLEWHKQFGPLVTLATFRGLNRHTWLVAPVLHSTGEASPPPGKLLPGVATGYYKSYSFPEEFFSKCKPQGTFSLGAIYGLTFGKTWNSILFSIRLKRKVPFCLLRIYMLYMRSDVRRFQKGRHPSKKSERKSGGGGEHAKAVSTCEY